MPPSTLSKLLAFLEAVSPETQKKLANVSPTDVVPVYHGTTPLELARMINGFDARQVYRRVYGGGEHKGVFVAPDLETAKQFGSGAVIEIQAYAKFLHGTDWSGVTGRDIAKEKGKSALDWVKEKFPNSFRPWMSYTMLSQGSEPQALLLGVVEPNQITRVWISEPGSSQWTEYSRDEFLELKKVYKRERRGEKYYDETFADAGIDLANPKIKLGDFVDALITFEGGRGSPEEQKERITNFFKIIASKRGKEELEEKLAYMEIGGSHLGELARKNLIKQIFNLINKEETLTVESKMPIDKLLHYLD